MTVPRKGLGTKQFGSQMFYYAGRSSYPSKSELVKQELAQRGIEAKITTSRDLGSLLWTSRPVKVDLSEAASGYYNPIPKSTHYKVFRTSDGALMFAGNKKDAHREYKKLGGFGSGYELWITDSTTMPSKKGMTGMPDLNPLLETIGTGLATGVGFGVGFIGMEKLMRKNPNDRLIARWETRGKKHWYELYQWGDGKGYYYHMDGGGGNLGNMTLPQAMSFVESRVGDSIKYDKINLKRVFNPMTNVHPEALESLKRYKDDLKAGHRDAAEYWRGQAGAYFTANPNTKLSYPDKYFYASDTYRRAMRMARELRAKGYKVEIVREKAVFTRGWWYKIFTDKYIFSPVKGSYPNPSGMFTPDQLLTIHQIIGDKMPSFKAGQEAKTGYVYIVHNGTRYVINREGRVVKIIGGRHGK